MYCITWPSLPAPCESGATHLKPAERRSRVVILPRFEARRGARDEAVRAERGRRGERDGVEAAQRDGLVERHADAATEEGARERADVCSSRGAEGWGGDGGERRRKRRAG